MIGNQYDTIIAFYEGQPTHLVGSANIKGKKIAWLHTLTEYSQKNKTNESLINEKKIYQAFDQIVAVSKSVLESFNAKFQIQKQKCSVIYNSIDTSKINLKKNEIINYNLIKDDNRPLERPISHTWKQNQDTYQRYWKLLMLPVLRRHIYGVRRVHIHH
mgnify:CR=1 FL=1